jgi:ubiquinone/menaquinone biosynthesis C-methylase UbiE
VDWMVAQTGLGPGRTVADVGAGTGKLTRLLGSSGARVVAVEPIAEMRALIRGADEVLDGTAESLPLADGAVEVITVAQAFHWFDLDRALPELHRVIAPGGSLVLFWNMRDLENPLQRGVEELLKPLRGYVVGQQEGYWRGPLAESGLFGEPVTANFSFEQQFTTQDLCDRISSTSFVAAMDAEARARLLASVRELVRDVPEPFPFRYVTAVYVAAAR